MKCLSCKHTNPEHLIYCENCGSYLSVQHRAEVQDILKALLLAAAVTGIFYLVFPLPVTSNQYLIQLFDGHIAEAITLLSCWSLFLVLFKFLRFHKQSKAFKRFRHPDVGGVLGGGIRIADLEPKLEEISTRLQQQRVRHFQDSIVFRRIRRIFHYLKAIPKKEEINKILDYQAEIDYNRMENSYSLLQVFIWAIPILGFIGTVFGIGEAVGDFSDFVRSAVDVHLGGQMRSALGGVTSGLSVAFNTTFLALVFVIPIMVATSALRKSEEDLLLMIEEYCLEEVLPHVKMGAEHQVDQSWDEHLEQLMALSTQWQREFTPLMKAMTEYAQGLQAQIQGLQPMVAEFSTGILRSRQNSTSNEATQGPESSHAAEQGAKKTLAEESTEVSHKNAGIVSNSATDSVVEAQTHTEVDPEKTVPGGSPSAEPEFPMEVSVETPETWTAWEPPHTTFKPGIEGAVSDSSSQQDGTHAPLALESSSAPESQPWLEDAPPLAARSKSLELETPNEPATSPGSDSEAIPADEGGVNQTEVESPNGPPRLSQKTNRTESSPGAFRSRQENRIKTQRRPLQDRLAELDRIRRKKQVDPDQSAPKPPKSS